MRAWLWLALVTACDRDNTHYIPDAQLDAYRCSIVAQECGPGEKCTLAGSDVTCVPAGPAALGAPCTLGSSGYDNCAVGGFCTAVGGVRLDDGGTPYCRALCSAELPCPTGNACVAYSADGLSGMCVPSCAAFSSCGGGLTCADYRDGVHGSPGNLVCRMPGGSAIGGGCGSDFDCVADAICNSGVCRALCDAAHPCAVGVCLSAGGVDACF
jgi:hypothetical protein